MGGYRLGVDLGTTWTAAAVARDGTAGVVSLSQRSPAIPSVVHLAADGSVLVGDAAIRRGIDEPGRIAREMKRRVGDPTPIILGGAPWAPELLQARVLRWVVDQVTTEQGGPAAATCVTHPANWGPYKLDLLRQAIRQVGVADADLLAEPVAAATWYATQHRVDDGATIAVYDLGGGTFDTAVVRRRGTGFELLGQPDGVERFGGIDVDAAVLQHVATELGGAWDALDDADPEALADAAELRQRCVEAKEALSVDTAASIPVRLPGVRTTVRITREELEQMIRGPLGETIVALRRTIASAGLSPADLAAVLLVGGSSRIPLVAHLVHAELGVPVALDANPKYAVCLGAALHEPTPSTAVAAPPTAGRTPPPAEPPAANPPPGSAPEPGLRRRPAWVPVAAVLAAVALLGVALLFLRDGGGGDDGDDGGDGGGDLASESDGTEGDDGLRVGLLVPDSGDLAFVGPAMSIAAELAVADLNDAGGVLGSPVELVTADTRSDPDHLDAAVDELLEAGVDVVVGPVDTASIQAAKERVAEEGIAGCVAHDTLADTLFDDDGRYVRTIPNEELLATAFASVLAGDGRGSAAIVAPRDASHFTDALESELEDAGIDVPAVFEYERGALDAESTVADLNELVPAAVLLVGDHELAAVVAEGERAGLRGPFYGDGAFEREDVGIRVRDAVASGSSVTAVAADTAPFLGSSDGGESIADRVAALLPAETSGFPFASPYVYDCIALAAAAAEAAGSTSADAVVGSLIETSRDGTSCFVLECLELLRAGEDVDWEGESGSVDLDEDGEVVSGFFAHGVWDTTGATPVYDDGFFAER